MKTKSKNEQQNWERTGTTTTHLSFNKKGFITFAQEVNDKGITRDVMIGYTTIETKNGILLPL